MAANGSIHERVEHRDGALLAKRGYQASGVRWINMIKIKLLVFNMRTMARLALPG